MTIKEEIDRQRKDEDTVPTHYSITKGAEEVLYFYGKQMNCEDDEALEILLRYASIKMLDILKDLGIDFDPKKMI